MHARQDFNLRNFHYKFLHRFGTLDNKHDHIGSTRIIFKVLCRWCRFGRFQTGCKSRPRPGIIQNLPLVFTARLGSEETGNILEIGLGRSPALRLKCVRADLKKHQPMPTLWKMTMLHFVYCLFCYSAVFYCHYLMFFWGDGHGGGRGGCRARALRAQSVASRHHLVVSRISVFHSDMICHGCW